MKAVAGGVKDGPAGVGDVKAAVPASGDTSAQGQAGGSKLVALPQPSEHGVGADGKGGAGTEGKGGAGANFGRGIGVKPPSPNKAEGQGGHFVFGAGGGGNDDGGGVIPAIPIALGESTGLMGVAAQGVPVPVPAPVPQSVGKWDLYERERVSN